MMVMMVVGRKSAKIKTVKMKNGHRCSLILCGDDGDDDDGSGGSDGGGGGDGDGEA